MIASLLAVGLAGATPLDLDRDRALERIAACASGDASACVTIAAAAERAAARSIVDHAWGNDDVAVYRLDQAQAFEAAACAAGEPRACRAWTDRPGGCVRGTEEACTEGLTAGLQRTLVERCAADPDGLACSRLRVLGWVGGPARVTLHDERDGPGPERAPEPLGAGVDALGRRYSAVRAVPAGAGRVSLARRDTMAEGRPASPADTDRVLAWLGPSVATLLPVDFDADARLAAADPWIAWSYGGVVARGRLLVDGDGCPPPAGGAAGCPRLVDVATREPPRGEPWPVEGLDVAADGVVRYVRGGNAWLWGAGEPLLLGPAWEVLAIPGGTLVLDRPPLGPATARLYGPDAIETGRIRLPAGARLGVAAGDALSVAFPGGWAELDLPSRHTPAWPARPVGGSSVSMGSARAVQVLDREGVPLAGVDLGAVDGAGHPIRTDLEGRGELRAPSLGGRDALATVLVPAPGVYTALSEGDVRAAVWAAGPGVTLSPAGTGFRVDAVAPVGAWAGVLRADQTIEVLAPAPPGGWSLPTLWAAARALWPADGLAVRVGPGGQTAELPGGPSCSTAAWTYRSLDGYCPDPGRVGEHLRPPTGEPWAEGDLVRWLVGTWDVARPAEERRARLRARVEALLLDREAPPDPRVDPAEEAEAAALLALVDTSRRGAGVLNQWFPIPPVVERPLEVRALAGGQLSWDGRRVEPVAFADEVLVPGAGTCQWLFYADPDTFIRCGEVYVRRAE